MKNLFKLFVVMLCGGAAMTLTSCLNSDSEDTSIDATTQKTYQATMSGSYSGKMRFYKASETNSQSLEKYDSLYAQCYVKADSTMSLTAYSTDGDNRRIINCLDSAIVVSSGNTTYKDLFEAVRDADSEADEVSVYYNIPNTSCVQTNGLYFISSMLIEKKLTYGDKEHYVYFWFEPYQYGVWTSSTSRSLQTVMYLRYIYEADTQKTISQLGSLSPLSSSYFRNIYVTLDLQ